MVCLVAAKVVGEVPKRGACQPTTSRHHLHSTNTLMWLVLWRTDTLLLFTVPGALQGILGPEGKPVPRFMWGMSLPQMLRLPQILSFWGGFSGPVGRFSKRKVWKGVWSNWFCTVTTPSVSLSRLMYSPLQWVMSRNVNRRITVSSQPCLKKVVWLIFFFSPSPSLFFLSPSFPRNTTSVSLAASS